jgi:adenylyltransferase/sulfurtransferase
MVSASAEARSLIPKDKTAFLKTDYAWLCASPNIGLEINADAFNKLLALENPEIIDVREPHETPAVTEFTFINIPLGILPDQAGMIQSDTVILFCQSGKRSLQAARILSGIFGERKKVFSLRGGIVEWKKQQQPA